MTIKKFKTIYFIYNADGGLLNEIKYWTNKNLLKKNTNCDLCDISHSKIFVRSDWLEFIKELKKGEPITKDSVELPENLINSLRKLQEAS